MILDWVSVKYRQTSEYITSQDYIFSITHAPQTVFTTESIRKLYRSQGRIKIFTSEPRP
mgnify:CR=1 FL=1